MVKKTLIFLIINFIIYFNIYSDILYTSNSEYPENQIYLFSDDKEKRKLITNPKYEYDYLNLDYSQISKKIICRAYSNQDGYKIVLINIYTSEIEIIIYNKNEYYDYPIFLSNNKQILLVKSPDLNDFLKSNLYIYDLINKKFKQLTDLGNCKVPNLSNDNNSIVFTSNNEIYTINYDGSNLKKHTNDKNIKFNPVFSKDNKYIYFILYKNNNGKIYKLDLKTNNFNKIEWLTGDYIDCALGKNENELLVSKKNMKDDIYFYDLYRVDLKNKTEELILSDGGYIGDAVYFENNIINNKLNTKFLVPIVNNLRFRESSSLEGKFIRTLNKGEKLEFIEQGKFETINGVKGNWVKVKTEKGEIGWCFDAYLEEVKQDDVKKN